MAAALRLEAGYWLSARWRVEGAMSYEDRDLVNPAFPPEGRGGERRHDEIIGPGDGRLLGRAVLSRTLGGRPFLTTLAAGTLLPTGKTRKDPLVGPTDATLQLGAGVFAPIAEATLLADLGRPQRRVWAEAAVTAPAYANQHEYRNGVSMSASAGYGHWLASDRVALRAGLYASVRSHDQRSSIDITNSGGRTAGALLRAAVTVSDGLHAGIEARVPIYRYVDGVQIVEAGGGAFTLTWQGEVGR